MSIEHSDRADRLAADLAQCEQDADQLAADNGRLTALCERYKRERDRLALSALRQIGYAEAPKKTALAAIIAQLGRSQVIPEALVAALAAHDRAADVAGAGEEGM